MKTKIEELLKICNQYNAKLVGVTKTVPPEIINKAIEYGITSIGENKVQELLEKYNHLKPVEIRFIGHLQTNKINKIIKIVDSIDSIDSLKLAEKLNNKLKELNLTKDVLIQVNISKEPTKSGFKYEEILEIFPKIYELSNLNVKGLMCIATNTDDTNIVRNDFKNLRKLLEELKRTYNTQEDFKELSMGMSHDYQIALDEGSTMIRIGSLIFGERIYQK